MQVLVNNTLKYLDDFVFKWDKKWYEFKDHRWQLVDIHSIVSTYYNELIETYTAEQERLYCKARENNGGYMRDIYLRDAKDIEKIKKNLSSKAFINSVIKQYAMFVSDETFLPKLDNNPYLLCFANGVYDLEMNLFRPGRPDDHISLFMPYDYVPPRKQDNVIKNLFEQIQTKKERSRYLEPILAKGISGIVTVVLGSEIWEVGYTDNSKSNMLEVLTTTFDIL